MRKGILGVLHWLTIADSKEGKTTLPGWNSPTKLGTGPKGKLDGIRPGKKLEKNGRNQNLDELIVGI